MTADRAVVALVLAGIAGGYMAASWIAFGILNWLLDLVDSRKNR